MPAVTLSPVDLRLQGSRVLLKHWQRANSDAVEVYVREFSGDGGHCRVTATPKDTDRGIFILCSDYRCVDVLEKDFDFAGWNAKERARKRRERGDSGEGWKYGDPEGTE